MASFRQHTTGGIIWAILGAFISVTELGFSVVEIFTVFILGVFASVLPDIDSDTSRPVEILFGILGIILPLALLKIVYPAETSMENILCFVLLTYLFIHHVVFRIFFKITRHRGIIHSIPAAIICGELAFIIFAASPLKQRIMYAIMLTGGFIVHLLMDEIWSVDLLGIRIKKSAGSALTFRSDSTVATICAYLLIFLLAGIILSGRLTSR